MSALSEVVGSNPFHFSDHEIIPPIPQTTIDTERVPIRHLRSLPTGRNSTYDRDRDLQISFAPIEQPVQPPPPEPAPWTATTRQWTEWVNQKNNYEASREREVKAEEALIGASYF